MDKSKAMFIIIIALLVILLGATGTFAYIAINKLGQLEQPQNEMISPRDPSKLTADQIKEISLGEAISTNLKDEDDGTKHLIKISLSMGLDKTDQERLNVIEKTLSEKSGIVRDLCLTVVRNTTFTELRRPDGEEILKETILTKLQEEFNTNLIVRVYISDLYMD